MSGTSQATAFVSGAAALLASQMQEFDYKKIKAWLLNSAAPLKSKNIKHGILAVDKAIELQRKDLRDVRTK
jgi:subtilisin family serine protease